MRLPEQLPTWLQLIVDGLAIKQVPATVIQRCGVHQPGPTRKEGGMWPGQALGLLPALFRPPSQQGPPPYPLPQGPILASRSPSIPRKTGHHSAHSQPTPWKPAQFLPWLPCLSHVAPLGSPWQHTLAPQGHAGSRVSLASP